MVANRNRPPLISVVVPTFRRLGLLRRAVRSVLEQLYGDFELIVSDDEVSPGESWTWLYDAASRDARIRPVHNPGPHGQAPNVNHAIRAARGRWIKPLYDDDILEPGCLSAFAAAVQRDQDAALLCCLADRYVNGRRVRRANPGRRPVVEKIPGRQAQLAMYLQDVEIGLPSQVMIRRDVIERGIWLEKPAQLACGIDTWWYARLLAHGDLVMVNRSLVQEHQGSHETLTRSVSEEAFDAELIAFRRMLYPMLDPALSPAPLEVVEQSMRLNRAMHRLYRRKPVQAVKVAAGAWRPAAWGLAARWFLRRVFPGSFCVVPRQTLLAAC